MYQVRVEGWFAAAHHLEHYHGKCERFHGHNYRVHVWAEGDSLGEGGMLVDFGVLKQAMNGVLARLDHSDLNDIAEFDGDPSAERIARWIFTQIMAENEGLPVSAVDVYETETSMARYRADQRKPAEVSENK